MKVAYLSSSTIPSRDANSIHVMKMCSALASCGLTVTLYGVRDTACANIENLYTYYGAQQNFAIILKDKITTRFIGSFLTAIKFFADVYNGSYDIIYARNIYAALLCGFISIPTVLEVHAPPHNNLAKLAIKTIVSFRKFIALVCISDALSKEYQRQLGFRCQIVTLHDAANQPRIQEGSISSREKFRVGYTGHLYPGRGIEIIISMADRVPECNFYIVGGTEKEISEWKDFTGNPNKNIFYLGFVSPVDVPETCLQFDILLAPYQSVVTVAGGGGDTSRWMSPLKIFEYMSYKKPILCSDIDVLKEVLSDGHNCLLCDASNVEEWCEKLRLLISDGNLRVLLALNAYSDFTQKYTWAARANAICQLIKNKNV